MGVVRVADIAEQIEARRRVYEGAFAADMARLRAQHGDGPVDEALQLIERRSPPSDWDARGHARRVARGIGRLMAERREREEEEIGLRLPPDQRQAIEMLKLNEMSLKEAAAVSGRSVAALKVATHRAIKSLRKLLGPPSETP